MKRLLIVLFVLSTVSRAVASDSTIREVAYRSLPGPMPIFDRGYLISVYPHSPELTVYGPGGQLAFGVAVRLPVGQDLEITSAAVSPEGTVVSGVSYTSAVTGRQGGLIFLDRSGSQMKIATTGNYVPQHVCFAPDGSVWTLGSQWSSRGTPGWNEDQQDYFIVQKYSPDGREMGAYALRSLFPGGVPPAAGPGAPWRIRSAAGRIGALLWTGRGETEWIELDFAGRLLGRWKVPGITPGGLAFTANGDLYAMLDDTNGFPTRFGRFDRASSSWKAAGMSPPRSDKPVVLLGADGGDLVFEFDACQYLVWVAASH